MLHKSEAQIWMELEKVLEDDFGVGFTISEEDCTDGPYDEGIPRRKANGKSSAEQCAPSYKSRCDSPLK